MGDQNRPKKDQLFLSCKGICFLCLKDYKNCNNKIGPKFSKLKVSESNLFSLHYMSRLLQLDENKMFNLRMPLDDHSLNRLKESEVIVNLCFNCSNLTDQFTKVFKLLEETKLKLNHCLHKISDVVKTSQEDTKRVEESRIRNTGNVSDSINANLMENMRQEIVEKCAKKLKSTVPRVMLERIPGLTHPRIAAIKRTGKAKIKSPISKKRTGGVPGNDVGNQKQVLYFCPYCKYNVSNNKYQFTTHLVCFHCEHFFPDQKVPNLDNNQYQKLIAELLFPDFVKDIEDTCYICNRSLKHFKKGKLHIKNHFVMKHNQLLMEKLHLLQMDPFIEEKLAECKSGGEFCSCGVYLRDSYTSWLHKTSYCNLVAGPMKEIWKKSKSKTLGKKKVNAIAKAIGSSVKKVHQTPGQKKGLKTRCPHCAIFLHPGSLSRHLKESCKRIHTKGSKIKKGKAPRPDRPDRRGLHFSKCSKCGRFINRFKSAQHEMNCVPGTATMLRKKKNKQKKGVPQPQASVIIKEETNPTLIGEIEVALDYNNAPMEGMMTESENPLQNCDLCGAIFDSHGDLSAHVCNYQDESQNYPDEEPVESLAYEGEMFLDEGHEMEVEQADGIGIPESESEADIELPFVAIFQEGDEIIQTE